MRKYKGIIAILAVLFMLMCSSFALANSAEPPGFLIMVNDPPEDLTLYASFPKAADPQLLELKKESKGWEAYFRFFYHAYDIAGAKEIEGAVITVKTEGETYDIPLPEQAYATYNNLFMLELDSRALSVGQSPYRVPMLVALRVLLTLIIEGAVFYLFGYREKKSWLLFFVTNLITQGFLNALITGPETGGYWMMSLVLIEIVILIVEMVVFGKFADEKKKWRGVLYAITANLLSLLLGGWFIATLPV